MRPEFGIQCETYKNFIASTLFAGKFLIMRPIWIYLCALYPDPPFYRKVKANLIRADVITAFAISTALLEHLPTVHVELSLTIIFSQSYTKYIYWIIL